MNLNGLPFTLKLIVIFVVIPSYLIGILFLIIGGAFKTFGYLFQLDKQSAAEIWLDMYDDVKNLRLWNKKK